MVIDKNEVIRTNIKDLQISNLMCYLFVQQLMTDFKNTGHLENIHFST